MEAEPVPLEELEVESDADRRTGGWVGSIGSVRPQAIRWALQRTASTFCAVPGGARDAGFHGCESAEVSCDYAAGSRTVLPSVDGRIPHQHLRSEKPRQSAGDLHGDGWAG